MEVLWFQGLYNDLIYGMMMVNPIGLGVRECNLEVVRNGLCLLLFVISLLGRFLLF